MKKFAPHFARAGAAFALVWAVIVIYLAYRELTEPVSGSEFDALKNFATGTACLILIVLQIAILILSIFVLKLKKGAWITLMILILISSFILPVSGISGVVFELQAGAPISVLNEISPAIIGLLLVLAWPVFFKKK